MLSHFQNLFFPVFCVFIHKKDVTIQSPISIPLMLHFDVASSHMKFQKNSSFM